ncbi:MAG: AAA family ATPase [Thermoguttaceae bacterium]|nr:AAA family ATPase [Thermoguttaceae bacterium]
MNTTSDDFDYPEDGFPLFSLGPCGQNERFVGRKMDLDRLFLDITSGSLRAASVYGAPLVGKTSLVQKLRLRLKERFDQDVSEPVLTDKPKVLTYPILLALGQTDNRGDERPVARFFDQATEELGFFLEEYGEIAKKVEAPSFLSLKKSPHTNAKKRLRRVYDLSSQLRAIEDKEKANDQRERFCRTLNEFKRAASTNCPFSYRFALIVDEFDHIADCSRNSVNIFESLIDLDCLSIIFVSRLTIGRLQRASYGSFLSGKIAYSIPVQGFSQEDLKARIQNVAKADDNLARLVLEFADNNPYLLDVALSSLARHFRDRSQGAFSEFPESDLDLRTEYFSTVRKFLKDCGLWDTLLSIKLTGSTAGLDREDVKSLERYGALVGKTSLCSARGSRAFLDFLDQSALSDEAAGKLIVACETKLREIVDYALGRRFQDDFFNWIMTMALDATITGNKSASNLFLKTGKGDYIGERVRRKRPALFANALAWIKRVESKLSSPLIDWREEALSFLESANLRKEDVFSFPTSIILDETTLTDLVQIARKFDKKAAEPLSGFREVFEVSESDQLGWTEVTNDLAFFASMRNRFAHSNGERVTAEERARFKAVGDRILRAHERLFVASR